MGTIKTEIKTSGKSLMKNRECEVTIKPSRGGNIRIFSKGADVPFNVCIENLYSTEHCVTLCSKEHRTLLGDYKYKVMLCEHFVAACAICGIDSIDVYLSETEMPIFDGSSKVWVELFRKAGIEGVNRDLYTVSEPVYYLNGKTSLVILPDKDLRITYAVNYDHPDLNNRWVTMDNKNLDEIIGLEEINGLWEIDIFGNNRLGKIENLDRIILSNEELADLQLDVLSFPDAIGLNRSTMEYNDDALEAIKELDAKWKESMHGKTQIVINNAQMILLHNKACQILDENIPM